MLPGPVLRWCRDWTTVPALRTSPTAVPSGGIKPLFVNEPAFPTAPIDGMRYVPKLVTVPRPLAI